MNTWNTDKMLTTLMSILVNKSSKLGVEQGEGGHWTDEIHITINDKFLILGAFSNDIDVTDTSDSVITHLYLYDQGGNGIKYTKDKTLREAYYSIKDKLEELGYDVVDHLSDYF